MQEFEFDIVVQGLSVRVEYDMHTQSHVAHAIRKFLCGDTVTNDDFETEYIVNTVSVPATGWDYIKSLLPSTLQFGWLHPQYRNIDTLMRQTINRTTYNVYPTGNGRERVRLISKRVSKIDWLLAEPFTEPIQREVERLTSYQLAAIIESARREEQGYYGE